MHGITDTQWGELERLARAAARRVSAQWPDVVERDDLEQDILVYLMENGPATVGRIFEEDEPTRQAFLIKLGHRMASDAQAAYDRFSGNYMYDSAEVLGYLKRHIWLAGDVQSVEKQDLAEAVANLAETNSTYYAAVVNRFVHEIIPDRSDTAGFNRVQRAVDALTEKMNRIGSDRQRNWTEGPGSRKVISNASSIRKTKFAEAG